MLLIIGWLAIVAIASMSTLWFFGVLYSLAFFNTYASGWDAKGTIGWGIGFILFIVVFGFAWRWVFHIAPFTITFG